MLGHRSKVTPFETGIARSECPCGRVEFVAEIHTPKYLARAMTLNQTLGIDKTPSSNCLPPVDVSLAVASVHDHSAIASEPIFAVAAVATAILPAARLLPDRPLQRPVRSSVAVLEQAPAAIVQVPLLNHGQSQTKKEAAKVKPTAGLSIVPPRPKVEGKSRQAVNLKMHKYYIDNAPLIRADLEILKEKGVLERWLIPYQTWLRLRHVVAPEKYGPAPAPKVKKPQRSPPPRTAPPAAKAAASPPLQHTGAPVFPEFNPGWDPTVQCEWFQCYAVVFGPQGSKVGQ